jgi:HD-GYP domain-containing protein (c-di-GMP phosphodiesterase class II)
MLKKISTEQLVPGMYIADSGMSRLENPYLYYAETDATAELSNRILRSGFTEVFIDTERCRPGLIAEDAGLAAAPTGGGAYAVPDIPITVEMQAAKATYSGALNQAKTFMDSIRNGNTPELRQAEPLVDEMLQSLGRNPDALLSLCKLRAQDNYTYTHCINVAVLGIMFAKHMGFSTNVQHATGMAGLFHDLGKSLVPLEILNAPRDLSADEFAVLREHPGMGYDLVKQISGLPPEVSLGVYDHHERSKGHGYPRGLSAGDISPAGRILAVADVYDALSSRRPYKDAVMPHRVLGIMYQNRNKDFYPGYVEHFVRLLGIYPVGSVVELEDGRQGVVSGSNSAAPTRPKVLIMLAKDGTPLKPEEKDINLGECPPIRTCLPAGASSIDPAKAFNLD